MLASDICVTEILRIFDCGVKRFIGFLSEACKLIHINLSFSIHKGTRQKAAYANLSDKPRH